MKIRCDYCGGYLSDTDEKCPNCGGVNQHLVRSADGIPKTIEELQAFCQARGLPLEKMRFFIGMDYRQPRAFGIFKDANGDFVVYKNKADGSRAIRYQGKDEAYAVNEIYQKLKAEVLKRKNAPSPKQAAKDAKISRYIGIGFKVIVVLVLIGIYVYFVRNPEWPQNGYYQYEDSYYYYQNNDWYTYEGDSWVSADAVDSALEQQAQDYWQGHDYSDSYGTDDFADSGYYQEKEWKSSDWDSDDWDNDYSSWDSSDTDWDSDW